MLAILLASLLAAPGPAPAAKVPVSPEPMLVSTAWLAERLGQPDLLVFHVGDDRTRASYEAAHIPGAQFLHPWNELAAPRAEGALSRELPDPAVLQANLRAKGVTERSRIVLYWSDGYATPTARTYLTLAWAGLGDRVSILDGAIDAWTAEGRPLTTEVPTVAAGDVVVRPRDDVVVDADYVHRNLHAATVRVVDARNERFYQGAETGQGRNGHIPGAANVPFTSILTEGGAFKDPAALRTLFVEAGADPGSQVVTYCHIGQQASLVWFAARVAGFEARMFDGSFQEWARRTELPVDPGTPRPEG